MADNVGEEGHNNKPINEAAAEIDLDAETLAAMMAATPFSHDALALEFTEKHSQDARFTAPWKRWHLWNGKLWAPDETMRVFSWARSICRDAARRAADEKIASSGTIAAVVRLAMADRQHAATVAQWDANRWLYLCDVAVDLKTGAARAPERADYCTRRGAAIIPGGDCPLWMTFLDRVTGGDKELQSYLRRVAGYCLTGLTNEHAMFYLYGSGSNGKSTWLKTIAGVMGEYALTAPLNMFMSTGNDRHPTEIAQLAGKRLVISTELDKDRTWDEAKINLLTGGDSLRARFMRKDFFDIDPEFKLLIAGNHKPRLQSVNEATRRRVNLIPFTVVIPPSERDKYLEDKLKEEWPGILRWMIEGCIEWQQIGLAPPKIVTDATSEYLQEQDAISMWIEETCKVGDELFGVGGSLFESWKSWANKYNEKIGARNQFATILHEKGFLKGKYKGKRGHYGVDLAGALNATPKDILDFTDSDFN